MKPDVSNVQLSETRKVSYAEFALIAIVLLTATKFCTLPSVLAGAAGSKAIWVAALLVLFESATLFFAAEIAKAGGLFRLALKKPVRIAFASLYLSFFLIKLAAFTREISSYYALSLFEGIPVLPIAAVYLLACVLLSSKGFAGIGRVLEIFLWLAVFVFLFILIFTTTKGDFFNFLAIFNADFDGFSKGVFFSFAWFGDAAVVCFLDLSGIKKTGLGKREVAPDPSLDENSEKKPSGANQGTSHKKKIAFAALFFSLALVLVFYAIFTSVYGDAAKMTDFAFIKLSAFKANADELGSADWPVIFLWAIVGVIYLSLVFLSGRECLCHLRESAGMRVKKDFSCFAFLGIAALFLSTAFLDEEGDYVSFMTKIANVASIAITLLTVALGIFATHERKENAK